MDFIKVVSQTSPTFHERKLIYLHCFDLGAQESVQFDQFPCLQVKLVLGHVSFPEKIAEGKDVLLSISGETDKSSEELPISGPF